MDLDRNNITSIVNTDTILFDMNCNFHGIHQRAQLLVIDNIHDYHIKYII